jgi:histone H3/H4
MYLKTRDTYISISFVMPKTEKKTPHEANPKKTVKKTKKNLKNSVSHITEPALQRILRRAGVKRISNKVYNHLRKEIRAYLDKILFKVILITQHDGRKTVQIKDLETGLYMCKIYLLAGINQNAKRTVSLISCNSRKKSSIKHKISEKSDKETHHRFKPGTVAMKQVKFQQKNSNYLAIPKNNFVNLVKEYISINEPNMRFASGVYDLLQLVVENHFISLARNANMIALHAKRETLYSKDLELSTRVNRIV